MLSAMLAVALLAVLPQEAIDRGFPIKGDQLQAFYLARAEDGGRLELPRFSSFGELTQGQVGVLREDMGEDGSIPSSQIWIVQLLDSDRAIAELRGSYNVTEYRAAGGTAVPVATETKEVRVLFLLEGPDLKSMSDGERLRSSGPFVVDGTFQYTTAAGSTKTIPVVRPTELPDPPSHPVQLGVGLRKWKDVTGNYEVDAAYEGYSAGDVQLIKQSGETITVPISRLGREEQEFVREQIKKAREAAKEESK